MGKQIKIAPMDGKPAPESCRAAFERIKSGSWSDAGSPTNGAGLPASPFRTDDWLVPDSPGKA